MAQQIPYKIYLSENEMPKQWYNLRADMTNKPAPLLNPGTLQPMTFDELRGVFCDELIKQELDDTTAYFDIPEEIREFYKMYRPSPLVRAYCLEKALGTPAKIYYKFEGNNTSGSHKLNSAIAQAYYAKQQGLTGVTTETGAGQWGTALSMACAYLHMDCHVYMVKVSYEQKPFRREVMRTYGETVTPSPSETTEVGRKILREFPGTTGSPSTCTHWANSLVRSAVVHGRFFIAFTFAEVWRAATPSWFSSWRPYSVWVSSSVHQRRNSHASSCLSEVASIIAQVPPPMAVWSMVPSSCTVPGIIWKSQSPLSSGASTEIRLKKL